MRRTFLYWSALLVFIGMAGCITTTLQTDWRDPAFTGTFKKVIVVCSVQEQVVREALEDDIAAQFAARGVVAVSSYAHLPTLQGVNRQVVVDKVNELNADGVFLVRVVDRNTREINLDATGPDWFDRFGPVQFQTQTIDTYRVETSLYETTGRKVVWQALSDTMLAGSWVETLKDFARIMVAQLGARRLI